MIRPSFRRDCERVAFPSINFGSGKFSFLTIEIEIGFFEDWIGTMEGKFLREFCIIVRVSRVNCYFTDRDDV